MNQSFEFYSEVQLAKPLPEYHFKKGDVATVVDILKDKNNNRGYMLEFFDNKGNTLKVVAVSEADIAAPFEHAVVNYRPYKFGT